MKYYFDENHRIHLTTRFSAANYKRLIAFFDAVDAAPDRYYKFTAGPADGGIMPLSVECLGYAFSWKERKLADMPVYSMAHYYELNGDLMSDPMMTVAVDRAGGHVIPLSYQQDGFPCRYDEVFDESGYYPRMLGDLDRFLNVWSKNIINQGFDPLQALAAGAAADPADDMDPAADPAGDMAPTPAADPADGPDHGPGAPAQAGRRPVPVYGDEEQLICWPRLSCQEGLLPYRVELWKSSDGGRTFEFDNLAAEFENGDDAREFCRDFRLNLACDPVFTITSMNGTGTGTVIDGLLKDKPGRDEIALIYDDGSIWWFVDELPGYALDEIEQHAARIAAEATA